MTVREVSPQEYAEAALGLIKQLLDQDNPQQADLVWDEADKELHPYPALRGWLEDQVATAIREYKEQRRGEKPPERQIPKDDRAPAPPSGGRDKDREKGDSPRPAFGEDIGKRGRELGEDLINQAGKKFRDAFKGKFDIRMETERPTLFNQFGGMIIAAFAGWVAFQAWKWGGLFSIYSIEATFFEGRTVIQDWGELMWIVPLAITFMELLWWPNRWRGIKSFAFGGVGLLDVASTIYGAAIWIAGRTFAFWIGGLTAPADMKDFHWSLVGGIIVLSLAVTFGPERLMIWAVREFVVCFLAFWVIFWGYIIALFGGGAKRNRR